MALINLVLDATGEPAGTPGFSRKFNYEKLLTSPTITASLEDDTGVTDYFWELVETPDGSSTVLSSTTNPTTTFVPDTIGTYIVQCSVNSASSYGIQLVAFTTPRRRFRIPAAEEVAIYNGRTLLHSIIGIGNFRNEFYNAVENVDLSDIGEVFVFKPGGPAVRNLFTDWDSLYAAISATDGTKTVIFDSSQASCIIPVGTWDMEATTWSGYSYKPTVVTINEGVVINNLRKIRDNLRIEFYGSTPPITDLSITTLELINNVIINNYGTGPFIQKSDGLGFGYRGGVSLIKSYFSNLGYEVVDASTSNTYFTLSFNGAESTINTDTIRGAAGSFLLVDFASLSGEFYPTQTNFLGTITKNYVMGSILKNDVVAAWKFIGSPYYYDVVFGAPAFLDANYAINLTAQTFNNTFYGLTYSNKTANGFRIELNSTSKSDLAEVSWRASPNTG